MGGEVGGVGGGGRWSGEEGVGKTFSAGQVLMKLLSLIGKCWESCCLVYAIYFLYTKSSLPELDLMPDSHNVSVL